MLDRNRISIPRLSFADRCRGQFLRQGLESIDNAVTSAEEDERLAADMAQRRRRPSAVEDPRSNLFVVLRHQAAGHLVEDNQAGGVRAPNDAVCVVDSVARVDVEIPAVDQNGAVGRIVGIHSDLGRHIHEPKDVGVLVGHFQVVPHRPATT